MNYWDCGLELFNRARGFTIGFWASAFDENLKSGLSPLGVSDHQRRLAFTAVTLLRKGQRPAIERQHLRTAFHTVHETGLIVSDRGWAPRRYLPGPGFAAALERQSPGWVACGRAVHAAVARSNPFEAFTVIDALEKGGLPSEKNNPLFPKQTAHQNLAADALLETVKQTILSQLDPLGASLSIMVKKWRETAKA